MARDLELTRLGEVESQDVTLQALKYPIGNIQTDHRVPGYWTALLGWGWKPWELEKLSVIGGSKSK